MGRFEGYAIASYPNTELSLTKSSVRLDFKRTRLAFDLVPMLAGSVPDTQILIRKDGDRRQTSVQKHIDFMTSRTRKSNDLPGRVKFNECVRLTKWWRDVASGGDADKYPTMLIDLLCAKAFDERGVAKTYPDTLADWFTYLAHVAAGRDPIFFSDYLRWSEAPPSRPWAVIDPVTLDNNIAGKLTESDARQLAAWLADARDAILAAISADMDEEDSEALQQLTRIFGNPILHHNANS